MIANTGVLSRMSSEVDSPAPDHGQKQDEDLKLLEEDFKQLQEKTQNLINETFMENEIRMLKKRANRLDDEVRSLKSPP